MNRQNQIIARICLLSILCVVPVSELSAQAYCALRDPVRGLETLYPHATSYRSIVKTIDENTKAMVERNLPPNTLHFGELGRHTLYVAMADAHSLGLVHVRSEQSEWGLVEIAWAMDLDLNIVDFTFQRIRSRHRKALEAEHFRKQLWGKDLEQIKVLFKPGSSQVDPRTLDIPAGAEALVEVLIRSAAKTLLVTQAAWRADINEIKMLQKARQHFPAVDSVSLLENHYTPELQQQLQQQLGAQSLGFNRQSAAVVKVLDKNSAVIGAFLQGEVEISEEKTNILWAMQPDKRISSVEFSGRQPSQHSQDMFRSIVGERLDNIEHCSNRAELMSYEAVLTLEPLFNATYSTSHEKN